MPCLHTFHTACLLALGEHAGLLPRCHEAIRLHQEIGNTPELARTYASYACLLQKQGQTDRARKYLSTASDLFRHMGMAWDLARAEQVWRASTSAWSGRPQ